MNSHASIFAMGLMLLLTSGCSSLRFMNSKNKIPEACIATCEKLKIAPTKYILTVNISRQTVSLFADSQFVKKYPCSTSRFGIGQDENSNCTPLGLHRIAEKIGAGEPAGTVFKSRKIIGHTKESCDAPSQKGDSSALAAGSGEATRASLPRVEFADAKITTRILWLEGLEPGLNKGFNSGGNVDSHARYIYIHGTGDQTTIGQPSSCGCIHLADPDLISIFDQLPGGTLVWIAEH